MVSQTKVADVGNKPVNRTSQGLRDILFDEIDFIRAGTSNPTRANAIAKMVGGVVETVEMEMIVDNHLRRAASNTDVPTMAALPQVSLNGK